MRTSVIFGLPCDGLIQGLTENSIADFAPVAHGTFLRETAVDFWFYKGLIVFFTDKETPKKEINGVIHLLLQ